MRIILLAFILSASVAFPQQVLLDKLVPALHKHSAQDPERLRLLSEVAKAYTVVRLDTAILFATQAITLAERLGDQRATAYATALRGTAEVLRGDMSIGRSDLQEALEASGRTGHLPGQMQARKGLLCLANLQGREADADKQFGPAMALAKTLRDPTSMVEILTLQGQGLTNLSLHDSAIALLDRAISIGTTSSARTALPLAFAIRAYTRACRGELDGADADIDSAFRSAGTMGDHTAMAMAFANQGTIYWYRSNMPKALKSYLTGLRWAEQADDRVDMAGLLNSIGKVHAAMEDDHAAMEYAVRSANMARSMGLYSILFNCLSDIGNGASVLGDWNTCFSAYKELARLADSLNNKMYIVEADLDLADSYVQIDMDDSAVYHALRCVRGARALGDPFMLGRSLAVEGRVLTSASDGALLRAGIDPKERSALAIKAFTDAIPANPDYLDGQAYDSYMGISDIHERDGHFDEALRYYKKAVTIHDSLITMDKNKAIGDLQVQYDTEKKEQQIVLLGKDKEVQTKEIQKQKLMRNGFMGGFALVALFAGVFFFQRNRIGKEKARSEELLLNILPEEVAEELKAKGEAEARHIDQVTVLFTDFKGFTAMSEQLSPKDLVRDIHECFSAFDHIMEKHGIEKIKTIGDAYMAAGGLPTANATHALDVVKAALEIRDFITQGKAQKLAEGRPYFEIRIGVHTGPVVAGIVGVKKFAYDIWGDTVNIASRMESSGEVGQVNISGSTYALVKDQPGLTFTPRGKVQAKGKGELEMYFVDELRTSPPA